MNNWLYWGTAWSELRQLCSVPVIYTTNSCSETFSIAKAVDNHMSLLSWFPTPEVVLLRNRTGRHVPHRFITDCMDLIHDSGFTWPCKVFRIPLSFRYFWEMEMFSRCNLHDRTKCKTWVSGISTFCCRYQVVRTPSRAQRCKNRELEPTLLNFTTYIDPPVSAAKRVTHSSISSLGSEDTAPIMSGSDVRRLGERSLD